MKLLIRIAIISLFIVALLLILKSLFLNSYPDFSIYYFATKDSLRGLNPYTQKTYFSAFTYPMFSVLLFIFLSYIKINIAAKIWTVISILCLLSSDYFLLKLYKKSIYSNESIFLISLTLLYFPVKFTLGMGQINLAILLLITLCIYYFVKKQIKFASIFLALSISIKLFPVLFVPYFLKYNKKAVVYTILGLAVFLGISIALTGYRNNVYFITHFSALLNSPKIAYYNQALSGFLLRSPLPKAWQSIIYISISFIMVVTTAIAILKSKTEKYILALAAGSVISLSLIINTFSWQHHFVWLIIPLFSTYFFLQKQKKGIFSFGILALSYILTTINLANPLVFPTLIQSHVLYGAMLLWGQDIFLLWRG